MEIEAEDFTLPDSDQVGAMLAAGPAADPTEPGVSSCFCCKGHGGYMAEEPDGADIFIECHVCCGEGTITATPRPVEGQPGHVFVGLDFLPVEEGLPDDNALVFMLLSPSEDEPMLLGYHEAGFWFFADGMVVGSPYTVTHWTDMPEVQA